MSEVDLEKILLDALDDERKAEATYTAVIDKFGPVRPFINIISAESRHSRAIEKQLFRLGFGIPEDQWQGNGEAPSTLAAACKLAVKAEIDNIALYDRLIPQIEIQPYSRSSETCRTHRATTTCRPFGDAWLGNKDSAAKADVNVATGSGTELTPN